MKISKRALAVILAVIMVVSTVVVAAVNVTAAAGETVYCRASFTPNCYMWKKNTNESNAAWPGVKMTKVSGETDIYSYTVTDDKFNMVIFNGSGQTGDMDFPGGNKLYDYDTGTWSDYSADPVPVISVSKEGGSFKSSIDVTITVTNADTAYYTVDGGSRKSFSGSATVTLGEYAAEGDSIKLDISAVNSYGTATKSFTFKKKSVAGADSDGSTSAAIGGNYATNPNGGLGARKTIKVDGDKSDWDSSMLIAQGVANDDPRVYAHWSMHEIAIDNYAMYAAWDDTNLYIMYEMANVQDVVAPGEDFPLTQGNLWIYNLPAFMYIYTGTGNITHNETAGGTLWDTGTTVDANSDYVIAYSTNASNGPFIYTANDDGLLEPDELVTAGAATGIQIKWGNGKTLSGKLMGITKAGTDNGRKPGDAVTATLTDFYTAGHNPKMDMFYEMSIPLSKLDITATDIETNGIGVLQISTFGTSGMDCLPYDLSMSDNAAKPYSKDASTSAEKEDSDHITVPMARVGAEFTANPVIPTQKPTQPVTEKPTEKPTQPVTEKPTEKPTQPATEKPTEAPVDTVGDVNNDDEVDIVDCTVIQRYLLGICNLDATMPFDANKQPNLNIGDVDGDDMITILDVTVIQRHLLGLIGDLSVYRNSRR